MYPTGLRANALIRTLRVLKLWLVRYVFRKQRESADTGTSRRGQQTTLKGYLIRVVRSVEETQ